MRSHDSTPSFKARGVVQIQRQRGGSLDKTENNGYDVKERLDSAFDGGLLHLEGNGAGVVETQGAIVQKHTGDTKDEEEALCSARCYVAESRTRPVVVNVSRSHLGRHGQRGQPHGNRAEDVCTAHAEHDPVVDRAQFGFGSGDDEDDQ